MVATDGRRLAMVESSGDLPGVTGAYRALLPRKAMAELHRVLAPDGWGVILVPLYPRDVHETHEDWSKTSDAERWRPFGQNDHPRPDGPGHCNAPPATARIRRAPPEPPASGATGAPRRKTPRPIFRFQFVRLWRNSAPGVYPDLVLPRSARLLVESGELCPKR